MTGLPVDDPAAGAARLREFEEIGVTQVVHGARYADADGFRRNVEALAKVRSA